jgi:hypothetical protein
MRASSASEPVLQRKCADCEEEELQRNGLQRQELGAAANDVAPPVVHEVLGSPGAPMDSGTRQFMETGFGQNFSDVRLHTDTRAAESARAVNALAYTVGHDIVFAGGQYAPENVQGKRLLAHELTHVVQQQQTGIPGTLSAKLDSRAGPLIASADSSQEREADALSVRVIAGQSVAGRRLQAPAAQLHRSVSINPTDPAQARFLAALTRLTGQQATNTGGTLALGAAIAGAAPSSATVTSYIQRAISAGRTYTLQSGSTTPGGATVRGVRSEAAASGTGVTITVNASDAGEFTWTMEELISDGFISAVSANDRTTATFPAVPVTSGTPATNLDDLLASPLPFATGALRSRAMDLIKQRVPAVARDIMLEVEIDNELQLASGITLAEVLRGLETNTPYRQTQTITGDRVDATYIDPRSAPGATEQQRIPRRTVTFVAGPGRATPSGAPVGGGTACSGAALTEITTHLTSLRTLVNSAITLLNSTTNLDAPLRANFGPTGPANRARIAANYRLILSELTLERHGWICNGRGSGSGCSDPRVSGRTSPSMPLVQLCTETSAPFIPRATTVLHEVVHASGIGSLTAGVETYSWQSGYPGSDPLHNADSYAQFPMAAATAATLNPTSTPTPSPTTQPANPNSTPGPQGPLQLQRTPRHGTEGMHHDIAEGYRRSHGLTAGIGPSDAEIIYQALWFPVELSTLATITPWQLSVTPPERLEAPAGSTPPATDPTYADYARARRVIRVLQNLKNLTYDYETDFSPAGRDANPTELQILDRNLSQLLGTFNVRGLVTGTGGRGLPTAPGGTSPSLAGRARVVDSIGDFAGKRYQLERWAGADRFMNTPNTELERQVRGIWADPAAGVTAAANARVTTAEKVAVAWFQGAMFSALEPAFYHPGEDKFYLSPHIHLDTLEGEDVARHETVHLLGGRETTRQAFITRFGASWKTYWKPFEEGMAEFVNTSSRTPAQTPPSAAGAGGIMSGYVQALRQVRTLIAAPNMGRDAVMRAYFTGQIPATMFQAWQQIVDNP